MTVSTKLRKASKKLTKTSKFRKTSKTRNMSKPHKPSKRGKISKTSSLGAIVQGVTKRLKPASAFVADMADKLPPMAARAGRSSLKMAQEMGKKVGTAASELAQDVAEEFVPLAESTGKAGLEIARSVSKRAGTAASGIARDVAKAVHKTGKPNRKPRNRGKKPAARRAPS